MCIYILQNPVKIIKNPRKKPKNSGNHQPEKKQNRSSPMRKAAPHLEFRSQPKSGAVHQGIPEIFGAFFGATDQENVSKVRIEQKKTTL